MTTDQTTTPPATQDDDDDALGPMPGLTRAESLELFALMQRESVAADKEETRARGLPVSADEWRRLHRLLLDPSILSVLKTAAARNDDRTTILMVKVMEATQAVEAARQLTRRGGDDTRAAKE